MHVVVGTCPWQGFACMPVVGTMPYTLLALVVGVLIDGGSGCVVPQDQLCCDALVPRHAHTRMSHVYF